VHYPHIWDSSWFDWVQYNASIEQPMVRNAGEALGVSARINLITPKQEMFGSDVVTNAEQGLFASDVEVENLFKMEQMLAGKKPDAEHGFYGLNSPKWPADILPAIDKALADKGAILYKDICQGCHLPPVTSKEFWDSDKWLPPNAAGERYLHVELKDIKKIGTDPAQAEMKNRKVSVPENLHITSNEFGPALGELVEKTVTKWYDSQVPPVPDAVREQMNGYRKNRIQAPLAYKVRPLNGIWATPPYLHNGSVPNLYLLLSPVKERPTTFYLGHREYDPVNVGYLYDKLAGGFEFDTTKPGNHNTGHEFNDDRTNSGVIDRGLTPDERRALVEYLKTL
jgi:hypothetical protein